MTKIKTQTQPELDDSVSAVGATDAPARVWPGVGDTLVDGSVGVGVGDSLGVSDGELDAVSLGDADGVFDASGDFVFDAVGVGVAVGLEVAVA
jgi:hypothetical protein